LPRGSYPFELRVSAWLRMRPEDCAEASVVKRVSAAAKRAGVVLPDGWKVTTMLRLVGDWAEGRKACPQKAIERAAVLFTALGERLGHLREGQEALTIPARARTT
jgi:hypothetical protein